MIVSGAFLATLSALLGIVLLFTGGQADAVFPGVLPGLMLMGVGYLKRIATALTPPPGE